MNLKIQEQQIHETQQRIWLQTQFMNILKEQQLCIFHATPATRERSEKRIAAIQTLINQDVDWLAQQTDALVTRIDALNDVRIQEILTRRYLKKQPFKRIAAAMGYDLRWVYRLHQQGLEQTDQPPAPRPKSRRQFPEVSPK